MRFDDISYNFNVAKVLSILMVATGHFFGGILWIPATFGLVIFGFSSGFFTSQKYQNSFNIKKFWHAKIIRLWCPILIIDIFLLVVFLVQQKTGIYSWQTLPSLIGMNGLLMWFNIASPSPFGGGLWFFTLLILYYFFYPVIATLNKKHSIAIAFLLISLVLTTVLYYSVFIGHMLWMTTFSFILGSYWGVYGRSIPAWMCLLAVLMCLSLLLIFNVVLDYKFLNYIVILLASVSMLAYMLNKRLPDFGLRYVAKLSGAVIQIYFIHTYLFIKLPALSAVFNYALSMVVVIIAAVLLSKITDKLNGVSTTKARTQMQIN